MNKKFIILKKKAGIKKRVVKKILIQPKKISFIFWINLNKK
jgi:hypothetical protein